MPDPMAEDELDEILDRVYRTGGYKLDGTTVAHNPEYALSPDEAKAAINAYTTNKIIAELETIATMGSMSNHCDVTEYQIGKKWIDDRIAELEEALNHRKDD